MNSNDRTVNPVGRPPGQAKSGGQRKGGIKVQTVAVKEAVLRVFHDLNAGDAYLRDVAETDKKLFLSLVARMIPREANSTVEMTTNVTIDIGSAMREAEARVRTGLVIDHEPAAVADGTV